MTSRIHHGITSWQIVLIILVANVIPLSFTSLPPNYLFPNSIGELSINENIKYSVYLAGISVLTGLVLLSWSWKKSILLPSKYILVSLAAFYLSYVISFWNVTDFEKAWVVGVEVYILPTLLLICLAALSISNKQYITLLLGCSVAPVVISLIGAAQAFEWYDWAKSLPSVGYGSLLYNQNLSGEFVALFIVPLAGILLATQKRIIQAVVLVCIVIISAYLVLTASRGAWVGLITSIIVSLIFSVSCLAFFYAHSNRNLSFRPTKKLLLFASILPLFICLIYFSPQWTKSDASISSTESIQHPQKYRQEFENIVPSKSTGRLEIWRDSLRIVAKYPLIGVGSGHYKVVFPKFIESYKPYIDIPFGNPLSAYIHIPFRTHNDYLQVWIELGLTGFLALVTLFALASWQFLKGLNKSLHSSSESRFYLLIGTFGGFVAWATCMMFGFPFRMPSTLFIGWLFVSAIYMLSNSSVEDTRAYTLTNTQARSLTIISLAIIIVGVVLGKSILLGSLFNTQGHLALKLSKITQAQYAFTQSNDHASWEEDSYLQLIRIYLFMKEYEKAINLSDKVLSRQPFLFIARLYRAQANYSLGNTEYSKEDIRYILQNMPYLPDAEKYRKWLDALS